MLPVQTSQRATLRPYQSQLKNDIYHEWQNGADNVLAVLPTGGGKTVLFSDIIHDHKGSAIAIAHRQELVGQISLALARDRVQHRIIGPKSVVKLCVNLHMSELGASYYSPTASTAVAGVDTLVRRSNELKQFCNEVTLWVQDEAHHVLEGNKWGTAAKLFENAKGLGVTATPLRADGAGLGRHCDGLFDVMVEGPSMRDLINMGFLTEYRVFAPPSDIDLTNVKISTTTGDYSKPAVSAAVAKSHVVGDCVTHYLRIAKGKLGVTFTDSVATADDVAAQFNAAGVPAAVVHAKTPDSERIAILRRFKRRELLQLVNVDLFGEGFDLPAIEVVSMLRPTQSYGLYVQQFGRALRLLDGKEFAIIIDHVGNVVRHGLPDAPRSWTLDRRESKRSNTSNDSIPVRTCLNPECLAVYERVYKGCPFCGHVVVPQDRSGPEQVDGDLMELDAETLAAMRGEIDRMDATPAEHQAEMAAKYMPVIGQLASVKRHVVNQETQEALRASLAWWGGYQRARGRDDSESYKRFYFKFGIDVMSAQALKSKDALALAERVNLHLGELANGKG